MLLVVGDGCKICRVLLFTLPITRTEARNISTSRPPSKPPCAICNRKRFSYRTLKRRAKGFSIDVESQRLLAWQWVQKHRAAGIEDVSQDLLYRLTLHSRGIAQNGIAVLPVLGAPNQLTKHRSQATQTASSHVSGPMAY